MIDVDMELVGTKTRHSLIKPDKKDPCVFWVSQHAAKHINVTRVVKPLGLLIFGKYHFEKPIMLFSPLYEKAPGVLLYFWLRLRVFFFSEQSRVIPPPPLPDDRRWERRISPLTLFSRKIGSQNSKGVGWLHRAQTSIPTCGSRSPTRVRKQVECVYIHTHGYRKANLECARWFRSRDEMWQTRACRYNPYPSFFFFLRDRENEREKNSTYDKIWDCVRYELVRGMTFSPARQVPSQVQLRSRTNNFFYWCHERVVLWKPQLLRKLPKVFQNFIECN